MNDAPTSPAPRVSAPSSSEAQPHDGAAAHEPFGLLDSEAPPKAYGVDEVAVLARDPYTLFVHWEITPAGRASAHALLGETGALALRLYVSTGNGAADVIDHALHEDFGRRYIGAPRPGSLVAAALGLRSLDGRFAAVAAAPRIKVPYSAAGAPAEADWLDVPPPHTRGMTLEPPAPAGRSRAAAHVGLPADLIGTVDPGADDRPASPGQASGDGDPQGT